MCKIEKNETTFIKKKHKKKKNNKKFYPKKQKMMAWGEWYKRKSWKRTTDFHSHQCRLVQRGNNVGEIVDPIHNYPKSWTDFI